MVAFACTRDKNLRPARFGKGTTARKAARIVHDRGGQVMKPTIYLPTRAIPKT